MLEVRKHDSHCSLEPLSAACWTVYCLQKLVLPRLVVLTNFWKKFIQCVQ